MAFIRRQPPRSVDVGTRPGLHGQTLISCGLADVDKALGGGLPLGCIWVVLEDYHSQQHLSLLRYFLAEGLACQHATCWITPRPSAAAAAAVIPQQSTSGAEQAAAASPSSSQAPPIGQQPQGTPTAPGAATTASTTTANSTTTTSSSGTQQQEGPELRIAWQYRKYIKEREQQSEAAAAAAATRASRSKPSSFTRSGSSAVEAGIAREWCHKFDLTKPSTQQQLAGSTLQLHCSCSQAPVSWASNGGGQAGAAAGGCTDPNQQQQQQQQQPVEGGGHQPWASAAACFVQQFRQSGPIPVPPRSPSGVGRLVVESLGSLDWCSCQHHHHNHHHHHHQQQQQALTEEQMLQALAQLRLLVQDSYCSVLVTCPAGLYSPSFAAALQHLGDVVVSLETLADDSDVYQLLPDPASAVALLHLRRLPYGALFRPRRLDNPLYVVRNKRRTIKLSPVEVDPDAEERQQQQQGGGAGGGGGGAAAGGDGQGKPAAAVACGGPPGGRNPLDF